MIRQVREVPVPPDRDGDKFTIAEAIRAFRRVRGNTPKPDIFTDAERALAFRDNSGRLFVADSPEEIPEDAVRLTENSPPSCQP